mmetsp:Transcript_2526/g.5073  ORF Transcript_2526/g.5073 Transcript_2526/m.5073 type:complete len:211 (+) Transcript_2526:186-818(+)
MPLPQLHPLRALLLLLRGAAAQGGPPLGTGLALLERLGQDRHLLQGDAEPTQHGRQVWLPSDLRIGNEVFLHGGEDRQELRPRPLARQCLHPSLEALRQVMELLGAARPVGSRLEELQGDFPRGLVFLRVEVGRQRPRQVQAGGRVRLLALVVLAGRRLPGPPVRLRGRLGRGLGGSLGLSLLGLAGLRRGFLCVARRGPLGAPLGALHP